MVQLGTLALIANTGAIERDYFIGHPDITYFKSVYRRHTNFSKYTNIIKSGENSFGADVQFKLSTGAADLLSKVYLQHKIKNIRRAKNTVAPVLPTVSASLTICANLGTNILKNDDASLELTIGGNTIFKNSSLYLETKNQLLNEIVPSYHTPLAGTPGFVVAPILSTITQNSVNYITCNTGSSFNHQSFCGGVGGLIIPSANYPDGDQTEEETLYETEYFYTIPDFSFNYNYGLSIPLLSLNNTDVILNARYNEYGKCIINGDGTDLEMPTPTLDSKCIAEYIHLDVTEKARFLSNSHEYIIENVHTINGNVADTQSIASARSLIKYILIVGSDGGDITTTKFSTKGISTPTELNFTSLNIRFQNYELYNQEQTKELLTRKNIYDYFVGAGRDVRGSDGANAPKLTPINKNFHHIDSIGVIPFCLDPINYTQPTGCVDNTQMTSSDIIITGNSTNVTYFLVGYNILKISQGQAHLLY